MATFLVIARTLHFAATASLAGAFVFECLVAVPAFRRADAEFWQAGALQRRLRRLSWASLALVLVSDAAWLVAVAANMSDRDLGAVFTSGTVAIALTQTRFGEVWLLRLFAAGVLALCMFLQAHRRLLRSGPGWTALILGGLLLASLAWSGHGMAAGKPNGDLHLAADILHLLAAGAWIGMLVPFAFLLTEARRRGGGAWAKIARSATRRFSTIGIASVGVLLVSGIVNTLFLTGTVPALFGTPYGQALLAKITLFIAMLTIAAVNRLRLMPRLSAAAGLAGRAMWSAVVQLRRNALAEAAIGFGVFAIVGVLGTLPPGLHTQPRWPFSFRLDPEGLAAGTQGMLAILAAAVCFCAVATVAFAAAGRYRRAIASAAILLAALGLGWMPLRSAARPAYPTSFYVSTEPYAAASIARGDLIYVRKCALCHGAGGRGNGPAAAALPIQPTDLTGTQLFAHRPGDLYWKIGHGKRNGVMPGFADVLTPKQRWDVINFIRARATAVLARDVGPGVTSAAAPRIPDFAFERTGTQGTLRQELAKGPVLLVLFAPPAPLRRLQQLAAAEAPFDAAGLRVIAVELAPSAMHAPYVVEVSADVARALSLFHRDEDGSGTELMLDRNGTIRARWTVAGATGPASPATLVADALAVTHSATAPARAGHVH